MPQNTWTKCPLLPESTFTWKASWDWLLWPLEFWWRGNSEHVSPALERNLSLCKSEKKFCLYTGSVHTRKRATRVWLLSCKLRTTLGTAHLQDPIPGASLSHCPGTVLILKKNLKKRTHFIHCILMGLASSFWITLSLGEPPRVLWGQ